MSQQSTKVVRAAGLRMSVNGESEVLNYIRTLGGEVNDRIPVGGALRFDGAAFTCKCDHVTVMTARGYGVSFVPH